MNFYTRRPNNDQFLDEKRLYVVFQIYFIHQPKSKKEKNKPDERDHY